MGSVFLLLINFLLIFLSVVFLYESLKEQEPRAPRFGYFGVGFHVLLLLLIIYAPKSHAYLFLYFGIIITTGIIILFPARKNATALQGTRALIAGDVERFDERDHVFSRNETLHPDREEYKLYYDAHPELKDRDDKRRSKGGDLGDPGSIDNGHPPNVSMLFSSFELGAHLEPLAVNTPPDGTEQFPVDPDRAAEVVKGFAKHLGADSVGICKVDSRWMYSHKGEIHMDNWEEWGQQIDDDLKYAVMITTEMDHNMVIGAPHTPAVVESSKNYAQGANITTNLARWFTHLGYRAKAQHAAHYDALMVPLAIDAGLGQLGRHGYLISDRHGCRVRVFGVLTNMPLKTDKPSDLGVEEFCKACMKCAEACPSKSISFDDKAIHNGTSRWKISADTCHDYWGKVGTDCCVCMAICPFSRPNKGIHKLARWVIKQSGLARRLLPYFDNFIYGKRWKPRKVNPWADYRR